MARKTAAEKVTGAAGKFVAKQNGVWNHADWESLIKELEEDGVMLTHGLRTSLGEILEGAKQVYQVLDSGGEDAPKKAAGARAATPAKEKARKKR